MKTGRPSRQSLDIVIALALRSEPGLLAQWKNVKRVTDKSARSVVAEEATAAAPGAPATTPEQSRAA